MYKKQPVIPKYSKPKHSIGVNYADYKRLNVFVLNLKQLRPVKQETFKLFSTNFNNNPKIIRI